MQMKSVLALSLIPLILPVGLWAEEAHHPTPTEETAPPPAQAPAMGMMPDMMRMLQHMGDPTHHTEGRIAFLHAELAITAEQETAWVAFADALRQNAALKAADPAKHDHGTDSGVVGALIVQQHQLERQLDGLVAINAALGPLAALLSEDQRRILDELLPHVGGMMPMQGTAAISTP
jgi:LTXXQ motif family protein